MKKLSLKSLSRAEMRVIVGSNKVISGDFGCESNCTNSGDCPAPGQACNSYECDKGVIYKCGSR